MSCILKIGINFSGNIHKSIGGNYSYRSDVNNTHSTMVINLKTGGQYIVTYTIVLMALF